VDLRGWITDRILAFLTAPLPRYDQRGWNDPHALRRHVRKGDVLLVEGDNRVSIIINYLTQSCWSHAALFIGDEVVRRGGAAAERARADFGDEAEWLLLEALPEGVVASPLSKYIDYNVRLVRPFHLRPEHLKALMNDAVAALGWRYDLRNVLDLARFLIPVRLVPNRLRRTALHFGSGAATEVICSSLLGRLFHRVGFPILPTVEQTSDFDAPMPRGPRGHFLRRVFGYESRQHTGLFHMRHPSLLTPRDFDLSPYFEVIKFNTIADGVFDYSLIHWADELEDDRLHPPHALPPEGEEKDLEKG